MAEKCTNTSLPPSRSMNPYPLALLNHLTLPVMRIVLLPVLPGRDTTPRPKPARVGAGKSRFEFDRGHKKRPHSAAALTLRRQARWRRRNDTGLFSLCQELF